MPEVELQHGHAILQLKLLKLNFLQHFMGHTTLEII